MNWDEEIPGSIRRDPNTRSGGIYFWIRGDAVLYVGQTVSFEARLISHDVIQKQYMLHGDEIRLLYLPNDADLDAAEIFFIKKYYPPYNKETQAAAREEDRVRTKQAFNKKYPPENFFPIKDAADASGLPLQIISKMARRGIIPSVDVGRAYSAMPRIFIQRKEFMALHEAGKLKLSDVEDLLAKTVYPTTGSSDPRAEWDAEDIAEYYKIGIDTARRWINKWIIEGKRDPKTNNWKTNRKLKTIGVDLAFIERATIAAKINPCSEAA